MLNRESPRLNTLVRIGRTDHRKPWNCAQAGEMLDWLVSRAILPQSDAVVRERVDRFKMTQGPQSDGRLHIVGKGEKGRAEGEYAAVCGHPVHRGSHSMLTNTEGNVPPGVAPLPADGTERSRP